MALTCGYLGIRGGFLTIAIGFVIGAAWSLGELPFGGTRAQRTVYLLLWIRQTIHTKQRIPYFNIEEDGYGSEQCRWQSPDGWFSRQQSVWEDCSDSLKIIPHMEET